jgi:hypothetical protein
MTGHPELDELELLAAGQGTDEIRKHVEACAGCAREVAWLKAEKVLFARRAQPDVSGLWSGIEARLAATPRLAPVLPLARRPRWQRPIAAVAGFAAAAAVALFIFHPKTIAPPPLQPVIAQQTQPAPQAAAQPKPRSRLDPKTLAALDTAESDYRHAASVLEAEYETLRPKLDPALAKRWDETLTRARTQLGESRAVAADDPRARMRVLDGYAEYLRSLRDVIQGSEEATP